MSTDANTLFTPEQQKKVLKTMLEISRSDYVDPSNPPSMREIIQSSQKGWAETKKLYKPGAYDLSNPEVVYKMYWHNYVSQLMLHDTPTSKRGTKRRDTTKKRSQEVKHLVKYLQHTPTCADLKAAFPNLTQLDADLCQIIDKDLEGLTAL